MLEVRKLQNQDLRADPGVDYELREDESNPGGFPGSEGSKLLQSKGFRDTVTSRCWDLP